MITAYELRSIAHQSELHKLLDLAIQTAKEGKYSVEVENIGHANEIALTRLGFRVRYDETKDSYTINW